MKKEEIYSIEEARKNRGLSERKITMALQGKVALYLSGKNGDDVLCFNRDVTVKTRDIFQNRLAEELATKLEVPREQVYVCLLNNTQGVHFEIFLYDEKSCENTTLVVFTQQKPAPSDSANMYYLYRNTSWYTASSDKNEETKKQKEIALQLLEKFCDNYE